MFRWLVASALVAAIGTSALHRRRARREGVQIARRDEGAALIAGRAGVGAPLLLAVLAYLFRPELLVWAIIPLPPWARWLGAATALLSIFGVHWTLRALGHNVSETVLTKRGQVLVTDGPYRWIRHPLYTTALFLFAAIGLMASNGFILLWTALLGLFARIVLIDREERALIVSFGDDYRSYMRRTGRLLPRCTTSASRAP